MIHFSYLMLCNIHLCFILVWEPILNHFSSLFIFIILQLYVGLRVDLESFSYIGYYTTRYFWAKFNFFKTRLIHCLTYLGFFIRTMMEMPYASCCSSFLLSYWKGKRDDEYHNIWLWNGCSFLFKGEWLIN